MTLPHSALSSWSSNAPPPYVVETMGPEHLRCRAALDAKQPYLDHHRPGGRPLLGTVMGIETMARAARLLHPNGTLTRISNVRVGPPIILEDDQAAACISVSARVEQTGSDGTDVFCEVRPEAAGNAAEPCFSGRFHISKSAPAPPDRALAPSIEQSAPLTKEDVYGAFFHGPWFQVVSRLLVHRDALTAAYAAAPPEPSGCDRYEASPREIEFCLQTAGLFELAETGRMMIPRAIRRIELWNAAPVERAGGLIATARRSKEPALGSSQHSPEVHIEASDAEGRLFIRVTGYETEPLPFSADEASIARLRDLLRDTQIFSVVPADSI